MTGLIWSSVGTGKTILWSKAPRPIICFQWDNDGVRSLENTDNIIVYDFSKTSHDKVQEFEEGGAVESQLRTYLRKRPDICTIVIDSVTSFAEIAVTHAILSGKAAKFTRDTPPTVEAPGIAGYGIRNRIVLSMVRMLLRVTAEFAKHCFFICHEDVPAKDKKGEIVSVTLLLGGSLPTEVPLKISEVWYLAEAGKRREIFTRPFGLHKPMRTRMFDTTKESKFTWDYDVMTDKGLKIEHLWEKWKANEFKRIPIPPLLGSSQQSTTTAQQEHNKL